MSRSKPLRPNDLMSTATGRNNVKRGLEATNGWMRELKGLPAPVLEKERTYTKRMDIISEHSHQVAVIAWWDKLGRHNYGLPSCALFAVPNAAKRSLALGAYMKAEGLRAGVPDLVMPVPRGGKPGLYIEMKREDGIVSGAQVEVQAFLLLQGYEVLTCYSADEAIAAIVKYVAV